MVACIIFYIRMSEGLSLICYFKVFDYFFFVFFFFSSRRRHTRFDCDWSSDVCSSDLVQLAVSVEVSDLIYGVDAPVNLEAPVVAGPAHLVVRPGGNHRILGMLGLQIGRASCRERV